MRHITMTGIDAGQTLCGDPRNTEDKYHHAGRWLDNPEITDVCPVCLSIWNDDATEETTNDDH